MTVQIIPNPQIAALVPLVLEPPADRTVLTWDAGDVLGAGPAVVNGNLDVTGALTFDGTNASVADGTVDDPYTAGQRLVAINAATIGPGTLHAAGLTVNGLSRLNGNISVGAGDLTFAHMRGMRAKYGDGQEFWSLTTTGDNWNAIYCGIAGLLFTDYANTARIGTLDNAGTLHVAQDVHAGLASEYSMWASTYRFGANGASYYLNTSGAILQCANMSVLSWGWFGFAANPGINLSWDGVSIHSTHQLHAPTMYTDGAATFMGNLTAGGNVVVNGGTVRFAASIDDRHYFEYVGVSTRYCVTSGGVHSFEYGAPGGTGSGGIAPTQAAAFNIVSARKFKTNIRPLADPLAMVQNDRVHAVRYTDRASDEPSVGFVAEDWLPVLPEVVSLDDMGDVMALDYDRISAVTFEALKHHVIQTNARLEALTARLSALEAKP